MRGVTMKKLLTIILLFLIAFSLASCAAKEVVIVVNVENSESLASQVLGESAMIEIGNGLFYDSTTRIVYWWNGTLHYNNATTPSPYYAPNGLPYLYNPGTNTFEEIER
jgi:hypothetical protein